MKRPEKGQPNLILGTLLWHSVADRFEEREAVALAIDQEFGEIHSIRSPRDHRLVPTIGKGIWLLSHYCEKRGRSWLCGGYKAIDSSTLPGAYKWLHGSQGFQNAVMVAHARRNSCNPQASDHNLFAVLTMRIAASVCFEGEGLHLWAITVRS